MRLLLKDHWTDEQYELNADFMEEKYSHLKVGDNVIHIHHITQLLSQEDLIEIKNELTHLNYQLSSWDDNGIAKASLDSLLSDICLSLNNPTVKVILIGLGTNALWDCIKKISYAIWINIGKKTSVKIDSNSIVTEAKPSFSLSFNIEDRAQIDFKTDNLTEENFNDSFNKIPECIVNNEHTSSSKHNIAIYNLDNKKWEFVDVTPDFLKKASSNLIRTLPLDEYLKEKKQN